MPKCKSCNESGLFLRLDFDGLCEFCHNRRQASLSDHVRQLEAFHDKYSCIPDAQAEAKGVRLEASREAETIIADSRREAKRIVSDAHAQAADITMAAVSREQELSAKVAAEEAQVNQLLDRAELAVASAKDRISALIFNAREAFASPDVSPDQAVANAQTLLSALLLYASQDLKSDARESALKSRRNAPASSEKSVGKSSESARTKPSVFKRLTPVSFANLASGQGFVAFDVETTGLSRTRDKLIELAGIKYVSGKEVDRFTTKINPGMHIPASSVAIHHITDDMVKNAPPPEKVVPQFLDFCGSLPLAAHNADFDIAFIANAYYVKGREFVYGDTLAVARKLFPDAPNHKLGTVLEQLGVYTGALHRSVADAEGVAAIVHAWLRYRGLL